MNFAHPLLEKAIVINEGDIATLIIENPIALRNTVRGITNSEPEFVLSKGFSPVELSKYAEIVTNIFEVDFGSRKIAGKLSAEAEKISNDYPDETHSLLMTLNNYAELLSTKMDYPIKFSFVENTEKIIKLLDFTVDNENMPFSECLLAYMNLCRNFFGKQLFVFMNLKCFLSDNEFKLFCKNVAYEKFCVLLIEAFDCDRASEYEKKIIIDNDLCVIYDDI